MSSETFTENNCAFVKENSKKQIILKLFNGAGVKFFVLFLHSLIYVGPILLRHILILDRLIDEKVSTLM